jgi:hypothetical protein
MASILLFYEFLAFLRVPFVAFVVSVFRILTRKRPPAKAGGPMHNFAV